MLPNRLIVADVLHTKTLSLSLSLSPECRPVPASDDMLFLGPRIIDGRSCRVVTEPTLLCRACSRIGPPAYRRLRRGRGRRDDHLLPGAGCSGG